GDPNGAACPTWSHDGATIVYSSTAGGNSDDALQTGATDLFVVPFNDGNGGPAKPLGGAADPAFEEYYPAYAPDDQVVVYTRVPRVYPDSANTGEPVIQVSQLYMTLVTKEPDSSLKSYPAVYMWNQTSNTLNTTPIWEDVVIPVIQ